MGRGGDGTTPFRRPVADLRVPNAPAPSKRAPGAPPPFTLAQLRAAVPAHCFKRSLLRSFSSLLFDLALVALIYAGARHIDALPATAGAQALLWVLYALVQGTVATGVWVIAHECGHGAFCDSSLVCDTVGFVFHSALLVPYFSWKFSHARHHGGTGSLSRDEVFVPPTEAEAVDTPPWQVTPLGSVVHLFVTLTLGWPLYLFTNASSSKYSPAHADHFWPWSPVFKGGRERALVALSDFGLAAVLGGLYVIGTRHTFTWVLKAYLGPYLVVNFWLVLITLLQHTSPLLPHFSDASWDWLRGACSTVDRDYGWLLNSLHHHIADTHVCHHLFSSLPHYHAVEATAALRKVMGDYAPFDGRPVFRALLSDWNACKYVAPDVGGDPNVLWFRSGIPTKAE